MTETDTLSAVVATSIVAVVDRVLSRRSPLKDPLDARVEFLEQRLREVKEREAAKPASPGCPACQVSARSGLQAAPWPESPPQGSVGGPQSPANEGEQPAEPTREELAIGCLPCARAHFSGAAGSLKEAIRFARDEGMLHPEVQTRLQAAEEELVVIERHDWTPEKILNSPDKEQRVIRTMLPRLREVRQDVIDIDNLHDLEAAAAKAAELGNELRLQVLQAKGFSKRQVSAVVAMARKVQNGELSMDQAKQQIRERYGRKEAASP